MFIPFLLFLVITRLALASGTFQFLDFFNEDSFDESLIDRELEKSDDLSVYWIMEKKKYWGNERMERIVYDFLTEEEPWKTLHLISDDRKRSCMVEGTSISHSDSSIHDIIEWLILAEHYMTFKLLRFWNLKSIQDIQDVRDVLFNRSECMAHLKSLDCLQINDLISVFSAPFGFPMRHLFRDVVSSIVDGNGGLRSDLNSAISDMRVLCQPYETYFQEAYPRLRNPPSLQSAFQKYVQFEPDNFYAVKTESCAPYVYFWRRHLFMSMMTHDSSFYESHIGNLLVCEILQYADYLSTNELRFWFGLSISLLMSALVSHLCSIVPLSFSVEMISKFDQDMRYREHLLGFSCSKLQFVSMVKPSDKSYKIEYSFPNISEHSDGLYIPKPEMTKNEFSKWTRSWILHALTEDEPFRFPMHPDFFNLLIYIPQKKGTGNTIEAIYEKGVIKKFQEDFISLSNFVFEWSVIMGPQRREILYNGLVNKDNDNSVRKIVLRKNDPISIPGVGKTSPISNYRFGTVIDDTCRKGQSCKSAETAQGTILDELKSAGLLQIEGSFYTPNLFLSPLYYEPLAIMGAEVTYYQTKKIPVVTELLWKFFTARFPKLLPINKIQNLVKKVWPDEYEKIKRLKTVKLEEIQHLNFPKEFSPMTLENRRHPLKSPHNNPFDPKSESERQIYYKRVWETIAGSLVVARFYYRACYSDYVNIYRINEKW